MAAEWRELLVAQLATARAETVVNSLMGTRNYSATSNIIKFVHWPLMGGLLHLVQRGRDGRGRSQFRPLLAVPTVTAHPSTASVPITVITARCSAVLMCLLKG